jgi:hypothetical protein
MHTCFCGENWDLEKNSKTWAKMGILTQIFQKWDRGVDWIDLSAFINGVMNILFQYNV